MFVITFSCSLANDAAIEKSSAKDEVGEAQQTVTRFAMLTDNGALNENVYRTTQLETRIDNLFLRSCERCL